VNTMSNKTFIPAFKAKVGDWDYYICIMKYAEVARQVAFAYELNGNKDLGTMIQRGISDRTKSITSYLLDSPHRFLGSLIVATWGGDPTYTSMLMQDPDGMMEGLDQGFGVLTFDGTQQYFALDGQHRLKAIKDAIKQNPEIGREDICVLLVSHYDTPDGKEKTRRLFTNINRNAKSTTRGENIALDVDDAFAVLARRIVTDHLFLSKPGVVKIFSRIGGDDGDVRLAGSSVSKTDPRAFTTLAVLYEMLKPLSFGLSDELKLENRRPSDDVLEESYDVLATRLDDLLEHCGHLGKVLASASSARDVRAPKGNEGDGHPFMRPVVQKAVCQTVREILDQGTANWEEINSRLAQMDWRMGAVPWLAVFNEQNGKMISGKDFSALLHQLLRVHLAPPSKQEIKRARKAFKDLRGSSYPVTQEQMEGDLEDSLELT